MHVLGLLASCTGIGLTLATHAQAKGGPSAGQEQLLERPLPSVTETTETTALPEETQGSDTPVIRASLIPPGRPFWVEKEFSLPDGSLQVWVVSDPAPELAQCEELLEENLEQAIADYLQEFCAHPDALAYLRWVAPQKYDRDTLLRRLVPQKWNCGEPVITPGRPLLSAELYRETLQLSVGPMEQMHAQLQFDTAFQDEARHDWRQVTAFCRLLQMLLLGGGLLGGLGLVYGVLSTRVGRPASTGWAAPMVLAAGSCFLLAAGVLLARWIPWI
ncbi:hypothetical protein [Lignipirellula cremea]|nr:hypothetical protein [Lignipirellula cremea]